MFWHFEHVKLPDQLFSHMVICKHCFKLVETGVMNLNRHLMQCEPYLKKCEIDLSPENCERVIKHFIKTGKL